MVKHYRYHLQKYQGMQSRYSCPNCGVKKAYARYWDSHLEKLLPYEYGFCNRSNKCAYHLNPYTDGYAKKAYCTIKQGRGEGNVQRASNRQNRVNSINLPFDILQQSLRHYEQNRFVQYLIQLFGKTRALQLTRKFYIGSSNYWLGASIFWLVDENEEVRGGQVVLFNKKGKTLKKQIRNQGIKRYTNWVHVALERAYKNRNKAIPEWLKNYTVNSPKYPIPFGLHQLKEAQPNQKIALVESAKTAIIASVYFPQLIWMAIGSMSYLNAARLYPLRNRKVLLFPDKGVYSYWHQKAEALQYITPIIVTDVLEYLEGEEGSDLADYLVRYPFSQVQLEMLKLGSLDGVRTEDGRV